jgi:antitoxin component YwqK of YwqJK toxin-antitoxin module
VKSLLLLLLPLMASCAAMRCSSEPTLASINLIDREGMSEVVTSEDRLKRYANVDFLSTQPYQKVLRVYKLRDSSKIPAYVTSYHPNGQLRQYLEVLNGRAFGQYQEWYANGTQKLEAHVIGGMADVTEAAEKSWLFDGVSNVWNEEGELLAEIPYEKGELSGASIYYYANGNVAKYAPFEQGHLEGIYEAYREDGSLLYTAEYSRGLLSGTSSGYREDGTTFFEENYSQGKLLEGFYLNSEGDEVAKIEGGKGWRVVFTKEGYEYQEFRDGILEGEVKVIDQQGHLLRCYHVKNNLKNGEDTLYYILPEATLRPKLAVNWVDSNIHGLVKTWYENGNQESQREMTRNQKNGLLTAWYRDGHLMMIEEYDNGKLVKGKYFRKGEKNLISKVFGGRGTATLFDGEGNFLRKISYNNGMPSD